MFKCKTIPDGEKADAAGHEVHVIHWHKGAPYILQCPPCNLCGGEMVLMSGIHPHELEAGYEHQQDLLDDPRVRKALKGLK